MMVKIRELNLLEDKKLIKKLNIYSFILMIPGFILFRGVAFLLSGEQGVRQQAEQQSFIELLIAYAIFFLLIIIHEIIHGIFFKLFKPEGKVIFGFKNFLAYASSPNSKYTAREYAIICLAPFILISLGLTIAFWAKTMSPFTYALLAAIHMGSCIGDFYFFGIILKSPQGSKFEDTSTGFAIYQEV